ncbi:MAG: lysylphosphatidylglycerol synthase domain-containing protein [Gemmatimonadota bacterium]
MTSPPPLPRGSLPGVGKLAVQLLLTILVTWVIVSRVGVSLDDLRSPGLSVDGLRMGWVAISCVVLFLAMGIAARLWGLMVRELGGKDPGMAGSFRIVLTANLARYIPGKLWQIAGLAVLSRRADIPATLGAGAGLLTQVFHLAGAAAVGILVLGPRGTGLAPGVGAWAALSVLLVIVGAASTPPLLRWGFRTAFRFTGVDAVEIPRVGVFFGPKWVGLHTLSWLVYGAAFAALVRGLGVEAPGQVGMVAAFSAAYLVGYVALFAPAGIGVREGVLIALLQPFAGAAAVGIALLARVWMTLVELLPAAAMALWEIFRDRGRPERLETRGEDG